MKLRLFTFLVLAVFSALGASAARPAAATPTITVRKEGRIQVAVQSIAGAGDATAVLRRALDLSGWVEPVDGPAAFVASGASGGAGLSGRLVEGGGRTLLEKAYPGAGRQAVLAFADDIIRALSGQPGIACSLIAFIGRRTGVKEVYTVEPDGAGLQQLTRDARISVSPALCPGARRLAYTGYQSGFADLYLIDLAGGARRPIIRAPGTNSGAAFSPDGSRIALTMSKDGNPELYVTGATGGGARRLTRTRGVESSPSWGPGGAEIIYCSDQGGSPQLYRIAAGGGVPVHLPAGYGYCTEPSWSPDGKAVAFTARVGGSMQIAVRPLAGGASRLLAAGEDPAWGPDSRHLVFAQGTRLVLLDTFTGRDVTVTSAAGRVSEPSWAAR